MDTSVFNISKYPVAPKVSDAAKKEVREFIAEGLMPGGKAKFRSVDETIIMVLAMSAGVEESLIRDWVTTIYLKGAQDAASVLQGATKIVKMHENTP